MRYVKMMEKLQGAATSPPTKQDSEGKCFKTRDNLLSILLTRNSVANSVLLLTGGTAIAQILNIASMPILSRVYSPADFGVLALFTSLTGILLEISNLRYYGAIPLPKKDAFADSLVLLSFIIQFVFISLMAIALFFARSTLLGLVSSDLLMPYWVLIPLGIGAMGSYLIFSQWAIREQEFPLIAKTKLVQSISGIMTKLFLGFWGLKPLGLLLGAIVSQAGGTISLGNRLVRKRGIPKADLSRLKQVTIKYRKFPLFTTWQALLNSLGRHIAPFFLVAFWGPQVAGYFAFSLQILHLPAYFVGQAMSQVFVQRASVAKYQGNLQETSRHFFKVLLLVGIFPILCLGLIAPQIFSIVFGPQWHMAGVYARVLSPWVALSFISSPLSVLFSIQNRQEVGLAFEVSFVLSRTSVLVFGTKLGDSLFVLTLFSGVNCFFLLLIIIWLMAETGNRKGEIIYDLSKEWFRAIIFLFPVTLALLLKTSLLLSFLLILIVGIMYVWVLNKELPGLLDF
mgnify:CR=1 FL=1